jgi:ADP-heptose:LPS heptosyltransferase
MNFTNDSAPMHLASAMNAPVTAVFCSTIPEFGFGPLSDDSMIIQTEEQLECRPCGLHGHEQCPEKTFNCAYTIPVTKFIERLKQ